MRTIGFDTKALILAKVLIKTPPTFSLLNLGEFITRHTQAPVASADYNYILRGARVRNAPIHRDAESKGFSETRIAPVLLIQFLREAPPPIPPDNTSRVAFIPYRHYGSGPGESQA